MCATASRPFVVISSLRSECKKKLDTGLSVYIVLQHVLRRVLPPRFTTNQHGSGGKPGLQKERYRVGRRSTPRRHKADFPAFNGASTGLQALHHVQRD
ncbi:hypothetical protein MHYP_G00045960 [Metynnis hypsauchen]